MRPGRKQGQQRYRDEVAKGGLGPMHPCAAVKPRRIDEKDDRGDHDLREPADDEEQRREHDPPEAELGQPERRPEVEHVPGQPEDDWPEEEHRGERRERNRDPARDERADPEDAKDAAEDRAHEPSIRPSESRVSPDLLLGVSETSL